MSAYHTKPAADGKASAAGPSGDRHEPSKKFPPGAQASRRGAAIARRSRRVRCPERAADRADRIRHNVRRRLPGRRCAIWRARHRPQGLRRHRGSGTRHSRCLRRAGSSRYRRWLRRRQERRAHRSKLRAHGCERGLSRGPSLAQALWSYGRQESRSGGNHGGQDQGHYGGAARCRDAHLRAHRCARGARLRRGAAARRALYQRRRGGDLRRGTGEHRRTRTPRAQFRRTAIRQSTGGRAHSDPFAPRNSSSSDSTRSASASKPSCTLPRR